MNLLDLPWEDILCRHILAYLDFCDTFNLRRVSIAAKQLVSIHWALQKRLNFSKFASDFTVEAFQAVTANSESVVELNLSDCAWLIDGCLITFLKANPMLRDLNLTNCTNISSSCVQAVASHGSQITHLSLKNVPLAAYILSDVFYRLHSLEKMDLSGCIFLDGTLLWEFGLKHNKVKWLGLADCRNITDEAVVWLLGNCKSLQYLDVSNCSIKRPLKLLRAVLENRRSLRLLIMTKTQLDVETEHHLKKESPHLTVIFKPPGENSKALLRAEPAQENQQGMHRANIPVNFLF